MNFFYFFLFNQLFVERANILTMLLRSLILFFHILDYLYSN